MIKGGFKARLLAAGASAWPRKTTSFLENKSAIKTSKRQNPEFFSQRRRGPCEMRKMLVHFFFTDACGLGNLSRSQFFL
jgi:hypothetical protein